MADTRVDIYPDGFTSLTVSDPNEAYHSVTIGTTPRLKGSKRLHRFEQEGNISALQLRADSAKTNIPSVYKDIDILRDPAMRQVFP